MSDVSFEQMIAALDRLNSWVRSDAYRDWEDRGPKKAIYNCKRRAQTYLSSHYNVQSRYLQLMVKCRRCVDGIFIDWNGQERGHCWRCSGSGLKRLIFIEQQFDRYCWHTPVDELTTIPSHVLIEIETEWTPNQPGRAFSREQAVVDLNTIETYWHNAISSEVLAHYHYPPAEFFYFLFLGKTPLRCSLCGATDNLKTESYRVRRNLLRWTDHACHHCHDHYADRLARAVDYESSIFECFPVPEDLLTPADRDWLTRHEKWAALVKGQRKS